MKLIYSIETGAPNLGDENNIPTGYTDIQPPDFPKCPTACSYTGGDWQSDSAKQEVALGKDVRVKRNLLIAATDYAMMPDYPISTDSLAAFTAYRQELRDITRQEGFPGAITWPIIPILTLKP